MPITIQRYKVDSPKEVTRIVNEVFSPYQQGRWVCCLPWNRNRPGIKTMKATDLTPFSLDVPKSTSAAENPILGTWKLRSLVFEAIATGQRSSLFGDHPVGYLGYSPDGRVFTIGVVEDRPKPRDLASLDHSRRLRHWPSDRKEVVGHVVNRLSTALYREIVYLIDQDVVSEPVGALKGT